MIINNNTFITLFGKIDQNPGFNLLNNFQDIYDAISDIEFCPPTNKQKEHLAKADISPDDLEKVKMQIQLPFNERDRLELIKRTLSYLHGALIFLDTLKEKSKNYNEDYFNRIIAYFCENAKNLIANIASDQSESINIDNWFSKIEEFNYACAKCIAINSHTLLGIPEKDRIHVEDNNTAKGAKNLFKSAEKLANWQRKRHPYATQLNWEDDIISYQIDLPFTTSTLTLEQKNEYLRIIQVGQEPTWFKTLDAVEQTWLTKNLTKIINGELDCPSSMTINVPGLANAVTSGYLIINEGNTNRPESIYHSTISRRTLPPYGINDKETRDHLSKLNASQLRKIANVQEKFDKFWGDVKLNIRPIHLDQSFLSPLDNSPVKFIDSFNLFPSNNNTQFWEETKNAYKKLSDTPKKDEGAAMTLCSNWAINGERNLSDSHTRNILTADSLLQYMIELVNAIKEQCEIDSLNAITNLMSFIKLESKEPQQKLLEELKNTWKNVIKNLQTILGEKISYRFNMAFLSFIDYIDLFQRANEIKNGANKELFSACNESLIVSSTGGETSGGCKDAKDRRKTAVIHENAILQSHYLRSERMPSYFDNKTNGVFRNEFNSNFSQIYLSGHQQLAGSMNIFGCFGKQLRLNEKIMPDMMPKDTQKAIEDRLPVTEKNRIPKFNAFSKSSHLDFKKSKQSENILMLAPSKEKVLTGMVEFSVFGARYTNQTKIRNRERSASLALNSSAASIQIPVSEPTSSETINRNRSASLSDSPISAPTCRKE